MKDIITYIKYAVIIIILIPIAFPAFVLSIIYFYLYDCVEAGFTFGKDTYAKFTEYLTSDD